MNYQPTKLPVALEAMPFAVPLLGAIVLALFFGMWGWALLLLVFLLYVLYFFRNPDRATPSGPSIVIAPADGKVVAAGIVPAPEFDGGQALRIAIFMNVFNVHVNWAPHAGIVEYAEHFAGKFLNAMENKSCDENERKILRIRSHAGHLLVVKLVAGLIARRIVSPIAEGDRLEAGEKIGLIRFGSRVEVLVPVESRLQVNYGMMVRGGETVVAILPGATAAAD
jgi:phosphatidylserine decarboxylase